jgi:hypothetical protein
MAQSSTDPKLRTPTSAGLLPIPDYSGDFWSRRYLSGDWGGFRTDLANKGVLFGVEFNQVVNPASSGVDAATIVGWRAGLNF